MAVSVKDIAAPTSHNAWQPEVGESIKGVVTFAKIMAPKPNFDGDKLEKELRIDLVDDEGEQATIWAVVDTDVEGDGYPSRLARAIATAVSADGADGLEEGGTLAVVRVEDIPPAKKGRHPAKNFEAAYSRPTAKLKLALAPEGDDDGEEEALPPAAKRPSASDLLG